MLLPRNEPLSKSHKFRRRPNRVAEIHPDTQNLDDRLDALMHQWDTFRNPKITVHTRKLNNDFFELDRMHKKFQVTKERAVRAHELHEDDVNCHLMKQLISSYKSCEDSKSAVMVDDHRDTLTGSFHPIFMDEFDRQPSLELILENHCPTGMGRIQLPAIEESQESMRSSFESYRHSEE